MDKLDASLALGAHVGSAPVKASSGARLAAAADARIGE